MNQMMMKVMVNGKNEHRPIDYQERCQFTGRMQNIPKLYPGETARQTVGGDWIIITHEV